MSMFAGWERINNSWELGTPGVLTTGEWMFSIADTFIAFITIDNHVDGEEVLFLGSQPTLLYDELSGELPAANVTGAIDFFSRLFPTRTQHLTAFFNKYTAQPDSTMPEFTTPRQAGTDLFIELCRTLDIEPPEQLEI